MPSVDPRRVVILAFEGAQSLDITGPAEIFSGASRLVATRGLPAPYEVEVIASARDPFRATGGVRLHADRSLRARAARSTP